MGAEYVTFDSVGALDAVASVTPGWFGVDHLPFYKMGPRVGENRPIPGVKGRLVVPREVDELRFSFHVHILGTFDGDGEPYDDPAEGALTNLLYWRAHVLDYLPERDITFTQRNGGTSTGAALVEDWDVVEAPNAAGDHLLLVIPLVIAAGELVDAGS